MGTGKDEIVKKENEELIEAEVEEEVEEDEIFEAMNNMFEQAEKEAAEKTAQEEDDANLEAVANMFEQAEEEAAAKEMAEEAERNAPAEATEEDEEATATQENSPVPKPAADDDEKKKKQKSPMMELVDELNDFVKAVNDQITDFVKEKGKDAWNKLNDTQPMKTLNGAMSELSQFAKDKAGEQVDKIADSKEVNDAKEFVKGLQDTVNSAFSQLMNMAANSIANAVKGITSPTPSSSPDAQADAQAQAPEDTADDTFANDGIDELNEANAEPELANEDDAILEAVGKMFNDADASVDMEAPMDSLTSTTDEPMNALSSAMDGQEGLGNEAPAPSVDSDLTEEVSSGLSKAM
ncbi:hypothetical protein J2N86_00850 [Legionella lytica]|uniref:Uncharacterized protein n=1 Tax=Legionella lytica TaxID=96232 RepID=A0ABY4Y8I8_9GAMM|nr:hypothetical protein [Legionella lytica]USQ13931.1 hypothetical protein J2N86_00850 [Legionella lytica]